MTLWLFNLGIHTQRLPALLGTIREKSWKTKAFIISPGQGDIQSPTGYSPAPNNQHTVDALDEFLKQELGREIDVMKLGYNPNRSGQNSEEGTVLVEFSPELDKKTRMFIGGIPIKTS